ncbi:hypothetical protein V1508DRAFT_420681 [Lipomyces doorenjongii]|uniref:uncharacterized protein n=1 Tax=Lipomyces doorenjongii TaxID=383834 RepID=UPI0034CD1989
MDASDTYCTALILDPRVKGDLLQYEWDDEYTSGKILQARRHNLHRDYPETAEPLNIAHLPEDQSHKRQIDGNGMLQRLQPQDKPQLTDIDRYFNSARVDANDM